jgi:hypothetical protein
MPYSFERIIEISLSSTHPQLLEGLDVWLRLGLISDAKVRQICQDCLSCPVSIVAPATTPALSPQMTVSSGSNFPHNSLDFTEDFVTESTPPKPPLLKEPRGSGMLQSLMAELSVRWLLFLGVFMVVVSSGVLAASQWERFPAAGQYGVLLGYTLIFWAVSFWAGKHQNLRLTAQTLQIATLLLVPVNFWAMDSFGLWQNPLDWIVVAIASIALTAITFLLLKNKPQTQQSRSLPVLPLVNILGLSYLHWGWKLSGFPLIAVYLGMVGTSLVTFYQTRYLKKQQKDGEIGINSRINTKASQQTPLNLTATVTLYALAMLLVRAIFVIRVEISQLGLALGICGWLVAWLAQQVSPIGAGDREDNITNLPNSAIAQSSPIPNREFPWETIGGILLILGWLVSVENVPWQAIAVSVLGLWFFATRLQRFWLKADLAALLAIGLQVIWLSWRLVPPSVQQGAIAFLTQLTNSQDAPWTLLSLALFPYAIVSLALAQWFYRCSKFELAYCAEQLTLGFGVVLTFISLANPTVRSLNLIFSTLSLAIVTQRRTPTRVSLVYLTHVMALLTLASVINRFLPNLTLEIWASISLAVMVAEWGFILIREKLVTPTATRSTVELQSESEKLNAESSTQHSDAMNRVSTQHFWRRSAWHMGLGLAALSYSFLAQNISLSTSQNWGIIWLITPLALTVVASQSSVKRRKLASWLSVAALLMAQLLTLTLPGIRLIGLGVATGLMLLNTRYLRNLAAAIITVGFGLSFLAILLWDGVPGLPRLSLAGWFLAGAIAILSLWLARSLLIRRNGTLAAIYASANDGWAIALCSFELSMLTLHSLYVYQGLASPSWLTSIATALTMGAIAYRSWQKPNNWAFYGLGLGLEVLSALLLGFFGRSLINLAIANIALGLMTQLLGEVWRRRHRLETIPSSWHVLPLLYGVLGGLLRWGTFTSWTGLSLLAIALIVIGVGRRQQEFKPLVYLGLFGVSISAYELLFYQLSQASGGAYGDALVAMSALGTGIMYVYRILSPWLISYLRLSAAELRAVSHIHWAWSSALLMGAIFAPLEASRLVGLATGVFLIRYAIFQGKRSPQQRAEDSAQPPLANEPHSESSFLRKAGISTAEIWVYLGLLEVGGMRIYWLNTAIGKILAADFLIPWKAPLACVGAYILYILPWETWGWPKRPWQQAAYILPLVFLWETRGVIPWYSLLITAGFYALLARLASQIRFTYMSVALVDWALLRGLVDLDITDPMWYIVPFGLSLLYVAQFDPSLKLASQKQTRHYLRSLAMGVICMSAFLFHQDTGIEAGVFSLIAIFAGLAMRVRAFLYVGTATFLLNAFYHLVVLILKQSFFKWVVGLLLGSFLIWIAANFETRREQLTALMRNWIGELQEWD